MRPGACTSPDLTTKKLDARALAGYTQPRARSTDGRSASERWSFAVMFRGIPRPSAALSAIALGAAVEVIQGFIGRDPSWGDLLADALGVATALVIWIVWRGFRPREVFQAPNA